MKHPLRIPGVFVLGTLLTWSAQAKTIHVPADKPTIQQGIDAAAAGDTVLVAAGVYHEVIEIINKRITLRSELGPFLTVIDGSGKGDVIVRVQDQSPSDDVVIQGFTVAHADPDHVGISVYGDPTSFVTIDNCWVFDNPGRGISIGMSAEITNCRVFDNQGRASGIKGGAGMIISPDDATITIADCEIEDNDADDEEGGGILVLGGTITLSGCTIRDNSAGKGGGIYMYSSGVRQLDIVNCLLADNSASIAGGGLFCETSGYETSLINTTVTHNSAPSASAIAASTSGFPMLLQVTNSIVHENSGGPEFDGDFSIGSKPDYSCLPSPWAEQGEHCVSGFPCFFSPRNGDYSLRNSSPCVDAGDNDAVPSWVTTDLEGGARFRDDQFKTDTGHGSGDIVDMGCCERLASGVPPRRYVNLAAGGSNNGQSWANAYRDLQDALDAARAGDVSEIWVAGGTYKPDRGGGDRTKTFDLVSGVGVYGGFHGGEPERDQRNVAQNLTVLTGAIGGSGSGDNSYHVVSAVSVSGGAELDGFIVQRGNASGAEIYRQRGGGVYIFNSRPTIRNCWIRQNQSVEDGAGGYSEISTSVLVGCLFTQNVSNGAGGGFADHDGSARVYGCLFDGNTADQGGGVKGFGSNDLRLVNCTLYANQSTVDKGGGLSLTSSGMASVENCIFWENTAPSGTRRERNLNAGPGSVLVVSHSDVEGYDDDYGTDGNTSADPRFVDRDGDDGVPGSADDDLRLLGNSPCIDQGDNDAVPPELLTDLDWHARVVRARVDMGAFEYHGTLSTSDLGTTR